MKTAISLPNDLFRMAETAARKMRMTRSELYARAITEFLERRQADKITERLDRLYAKERSELHPALQAAEINSLNKGDW